ncbi:MAG TPA: aminotransferase class I/II-fold pyridoxal phosphate-dependent enzyme [Blastocatellia bacterium]|nr:aminotransferase class I/II-fold pyridoxal phosphate-dependent enzyme [Blastocatellia bacterium]
MSNTERVKASPYIEWAKTEAAARFNLATSGLIHYPLAELPVTLADLELSGPSFYGYAPLQQALAKKCGVDTDCVVQATGTSLANHLAMATLLEPGDEVIVEQPGYDPLLAVPRYLGATVKRLERRREDGFRVDLAELERRVSSRTRLIVLTNMHNPTGALTGEETLKQVGELARSVGARVLVDEVYLEAIFDDARPYAFQLGREFVTTSSLTKAYGLSGLRCGWILAEPELARRIWRLHDIFGGIPAHPAERLSVVALHHLDRIAARAKALLDANWRALDHFLESRRDLESFRPRFGTVVSPRLRHGQVDDLCALLREKYETSIVPGRFFEMPEHFRIGIGIPGDILREGLARLGAALDEMAKRS